MSLTKTLSPNGVLVAVNGYDLRQPQVIEDIVDSLNVSEISLSAPPYSVSVDSTSDAASNTAAINQAISDYSGTNTVLVMPPGTIYLDQAAGGAQYSIYFGPGTSKLTLKGAGEYGTKLIQQGDGDGGDWHAILVDRAQDIVLSDFYIEQGIIKAPDGIQLNHLINIVNSSLDATGTTRNIKVRNVGFGKCLGDQLRLFGDTTPVSEITGTDLYFNGEGICIQPWAPSTLFPINSWVINDSGKNYRCTTAGISASSGGPTGTGSGITDGAAVWEYKSPREGARTCISIQRGYDKVNLSSLFAKGAQNSVLDVEPTGAGGGYAGTEVMQYLSITDAVFDNSLGNTAYAATFSGITASTKTKYNSLNNVTIINGALYLIQTTSTTLNNVKVINRSLFAADTSTPNILLRQTNDDLVVNGLRLERGDSCAAGNLFDMEEGARPILKDFFCLQETNSNMILFEGTTRVTVKDGFVYYAGTVPSGKDVIAISAINSNADFPLVANVTADVSSGKFRSVAAFYTRSSQSCTNITALNLVAPGKTNYGVLFSFGAGTTFDANPLVMGVDATGDAAWRSEDASEVVITTVFPVIGGNAGGVLWLSGTGAPSGTYPFGSLYSRLDGGSGTSLYTYRGGTGWVGIG